MSACLLQIYPSSLFIHLDQVIIMSEFYDVFIDIIFQKFWPVKTEKTWDQHGIIWTNLIFIILNLLSFYCQTKIGFFPSTIVERQLNGCSAPSTKKYLQHFDFFESLIEAMQCKSGLDYLMANTYGYKFFCLGTQEKKINSILLIQ